MATLVQSLALFSAMYFIEIQSKKRQELLKYPNDPEVEVADKEDEEKIKIYKAATMWQKVTIVPKINLITMFLDSVFLSVLWACWINVLCTL